MTRQCGETHVNMHPWKGRKGTVNAQGRVGQVGRLARSPTYPLLSLPSELMNSVSMEAGMEVPPWLRI